MVDFRSYILPTFLALLIHGLVLALLSTHWIDHSEPKRSMPRHIQAQMIDLNALAERQAEQERITQEKAKQAEAAKAKAQREREQAAAEKRRQELERKKAKAEAERKAKQEAERKRQQEIARKREAEQKKKAELAARKKAEAEARKRKAEEQARREAEKAKQEAAERARKEAERREQQAKAEQELQQALERERQARAKAEAAAAARQQSQAVIGDIRSYIQAVLQDSWRIPSTARNGMEAIVTIHLLPSGEVDQAYIAKSSGNAAFDNTAVQAVYRVQSFPRVADVDPILFERQLRKLQVKFKPEGLRW
ncbi:cell envelope integrity protein TolA [Marinobacterium stanieri]|uniref:Cell division and transport-associated protein TolA n=1 Tax=Marinobacterium stanieri TaxID=49186 RepID=A0A1N6RLJ3_9GAMM|nr:cell envelope integrity protein TolA [Marinobacterium stanieri]SIQ29582.1 Cell division and transport-associated protein TolA [Marinobacterium stanieri]